ncbi:N-formylglutamate amidohydrolase [Sorangium sp. So ce1024]|uniref:N-formylglutamate amidohydrolase n=1 Tax=Sorangium sp. So ce1024 TaxID=3133327 RepID=UPI003F0CAEDE
MTAPHFEILGPDVPGPVVVEVPHAGLGLEPLTARGLGLPSIALEAGAPWADSDVGAAAVCEGLEAMGVRRIVATVSRYVVDLNTEPRVPTPYEDKRPPGLGDVRNISRAGVMWWERRRSRAEVEELLAEVFEPYHEAVAAELAASRARHGRAALLAVHTYPDGGRKDAADVVLGTRNGRCARPAVRDALARVAQDHGLSVGIEAPFPGGYSVVRHAAPGIEAIQIELARSLVCSPGDRRRPALDPDRVARMAEVLRSVVGVLVAEVAGGAS